MQNQAHLDKMLEGGFQMQQKPQKPAKRGRGSRGRGQSGPNHVRRHENHDNPSIHTTFHASGFRYDRKNQQQSVDFKTQTAQLGDKIIASRDAIERSEFFRAILALFTRARCAKVDQIVSYGIGSIEDSARSQCQLAFLLLLRDTLNAKECFAFDPAFTRVDNAVLRHLDISLINQNEKGHRAAIGSTLFFMPHCGKTLYANVLRANWNRATLQSIYIVGNSLHHMEATANAADRPYLESLIRIAPFSHELALPELRSRPDAFNDTSLSYFRIAEDDPPLLPPPENVTFWTQPPEGPESDGRFDPEVK